MLYHLSIAQWNDREKALEDGDKDKAERILNMGRVDGYTSDMSDYEDAVIEEEIDEDDILADVSAGLTNKEIYEKHNISPKRLSMIKNGAK